MGPAHVERSLTKALGAEDVSMDYYELEPGEVTFETESGEVTASAGEAIGIAPGE